MRWLVILCFLMFLPGASAAPGLNWLAPPQAYSGQSLQVAYAIVQSEDPFMLQGHVNVRGEMWLDDDLLWASASLHEHDGFWSFIATPPRAGQLRLVAVPNGGDPVEATMQVIQSQPHVDMQEQFRQLVWTEEPAAVVDKWRVETASEAPPSNDSSVMTAPGALVDIRDGAGRLVLSTWQNHDAAFEYDEKWGGTAAQALITGPDHQKHMTNQFGLMVLDHTMQSKAANYVGAPLPPLPDPMREACGAADLPFIVDPEPHRAGVPAWDWDTAIRVSLVNNAPATDNSLASQVTYVLDRVGPGPDARLFAVDASDTWGQITFRAPVPGSYDLHVTGAGIECTYAFEVLGPESTPVSVEAQPTPGTLEASVTVDGTSAKLAFAALKANGDPNPHHEFDTRVYREGADGGLVWKGKMHGHGGLVSLDLHALEPGDYVVQVYPSPQDQGDAAVATEDPAGFRYTFQVEGPAPQAEETQEESPALPVVLLLSLVAGLVALRRRR